MLSIDMSDYNGKARACWWITTVLGWLALVYALFATFSLSLYSLGGIAALMATVYLGGLRAISIAGTRTSITSGDVFVFLALLFWGVPAATLVAVTDAFAASYGTSRRWTSRLGSPAIMAITIVVSGSLFEWSLAFARARGLYSTATMLIALLVFSSFYFFLNSALLTIHVALKKQASMVTVWRTNYTWAILPYAASASAAGLIFLAVEQNGLSSLLAAGPLVAIIFATCHLQFKRADERANAAVERAWLAEIHLSDMEESEERFRSAFIHAPIGMALMDSDGKLVQVNRALCEVIGYAESELVGSDLRTVTHPADREVAADNVARLLAVEMASTVSEQRYLHKLGHEVWVLVSTSLVRDPHQHTPLVIFQIQDITDRKQAKQLAYSASHDPLTGLPNRALFIDKLTLALSHVRRKHDQAFALLFLDCDRFKQINDSLGHLVGDQLLVAIARRLESATRSGDIVARLGGDEFTILLQGITCRKEAMSLADRIQKELAAPFEIDGNELLISASIGIALSGDGDQTPQSILRDADIAMYHAKSLGNARSALFSDTPQSTMISNALFKGDPEEQLSFDSQDWNNSSESLRTGYDECNFFQPGGLEGEASIQG